MSNLPQHARSMATWLETRPSGPTPAGAPMLLHQCADRIESLSTHVERLIAFIAMAAAAQEASLSEDREA